MSNISSRALGEIIAVASVVFSLLFVGLQFRQSTIAAKAAAYQELGIATAELLQSLAANGELHNIIEQAASSEIDGISSMSASDLSRAKDWTEGTLRLYETIYLQVQQGLLEPEALEYLGWAGFREGNLLKNMWPHVKDGIPPEFAAYLEAIWAGSP